MSIRNVSALTQHLCSILGPPSCTLARAHMLHPWPTLMHARICTPTPTGTGGACAHTCSSAQLINSAVGNCAECLRLRVDWQFRRRFHEPPERCPVVFVGLRGDIKHHIGRRGALSAYSGRVMNPHSNASQTVPPINVFCGPFAFIQLRFEIRRDRVFFPLCNQKLRGVTEVRATFAHSLGSAGEVRDGSASMALASSADSSLGY